MFFIGLGRIDVDEHSWLVYFQMQNLLQVFSDHAYGTLIQRRYQKLTEELRTKNHGMPTSMFERWNHDPSIISAKAFDELIDETAMNYGMINQKHHDAV